MTELSFLIELLLNHKLPKPTKDAIAERIKDIQMAPASLPEPGYIRPVAQPQMETPIALTTPDNKPMAQQSPSTVAALLKHGLAIGSAVVATPPVAPEPVAVIAQTPAAMAALQSRRAAIAAGNSGAFQGRPAAGETSPRKF